MTPQINLLKRAGASFSRKIAVAILAATLITTSAFAGGEEDKAKAIKNLKKEFSTAKDIQWKVAENYIKASFNWNDQQLEVFYNYDGELIAKSRHVNPSALPIEAQQKMETKYAGYKIDECVEMTNEDGVNFYVSLIKENKKTILQVSPYGDVLVY
jgi:hypothetical protein